VELPLRSIPAGTIPSKIFRRRLKNFSDSLDGGHLWLIFPHASREDTKT
jgi:hypothetical protein